MSYFVTFTIYLELLTFIVSLITYNKYKNTPLYLLPLFFGLIAFIELFSFHFYPKNNVWLHNLLNVFELNFWMYVFWQYFTAKNKKVIISFLLIYNVFVLGSFVFGLQDFMNSQTSYNYLLSYLMIAITAILMLYQRLYYDALEQSIKNDLLYWICFGLILFYGSAIPLFSISNWVLTMGDLRIYMRIMLVFVVLVKNLIFITGFLCCKKIS